MRYSSTCAGAALVLLSWFCAPAAEAIDRRVVVSNQYGGTVVAYEQISSVAVATQAVFSAIEWPAALQPADLDSNGRLDLAVAANQAPGTILWLKNPAGGPAWTTNLIMSGEGRPTALAVGDIDADGHRDVAAALNATHRLMWWRNSDGLGTTWTGRVIAASYTSPFSIELADLSGNGRHDDVLATSYGLGEVTWFRNVAGDGTEWTRHVIASGAANAMHARAADITGNGQNDVVALYNNQVVLFENHGGGLVWSSRVVAANFADPRTLALADVNGNGQVDILAGTQGGRIDVWYNNGAGTGWTRENVATAFGEIRSLWTVDMDGDGDMDILASSFTGNEVAWWERREDSWRKWPVDNRVRGASAVCAADFTGNGAPDLAGASLSSNRVSLWSAHLNYAIGPFQAVPPPVATNLFTGNKRVVYAVTNSPLQTGAGEQQVCTGWTGTGSIPDGTGLNTGARLIDSNSSIRWLWQTRYHLNVRTNASGVSSAASGWHNAGETLEIEAVATAPGYAFIRWDGLQPPLQSANPVLLTMDRAYDIMPVFGLNQLRITTGAGPYGRIDPEGEIEVPEGGSQGFHIIPATGYRVASVAINGQPVGVSDYIEFSNLRADATLSATFERDSIALRVTSPHGVTAPPAGQTTFFEGGTTGVCSVLNSPVAVGAHTQLVCRGWTGTGNVPPTGTGTSTPHFQLYVYSSITWNWTTQALLRVEVDGQGTTDVDPVRWVDLGEETLLRAFPSAGHVFTHWSGDVPSVAARDNPLTAGMDRSRLITAHFAPYQPVIQAASGNNGRIEPAGTITTDYLSTPGFSIIPDDGYRIASVLVDGVSVGVPSFYEFPPVAADHTIMAAFEKADFKLVVSSAHGAPEPEKGTNVIEAAAAFTCRLPESPVSDGSATQYVCTGWTGSGSIPATGTALETPLLIMQADSSIQWNWITQYWFSVTAAPGGTATAIDGWRNAHEPLTLTATADAGHIFHAWSGNVQGINPQANPLTLTPDGPRTLQATFEPLTYRITASAGANGTISPTGATEVAYGAEVTYVFTPANRYRVADVLIDGVSIGPVGSHTFDSVAANHTIHVTFTLDFYSLTVTSAHGTPSPAGLTNVFTGTELACSVAGSPVLSGGTQLVCIGWTGTGSAPPAGTTTSTPPFSLLENSTLAWNWRTYYLLAATSAPNGRISSTGGWHQAGAEVVIEARADTGYKFDHWSGDVPGSLAKANPLTLDMSRARTLRANYSTNLARITTHITGTGGSITPDSRDVRPGEDATFQITPLPGHRLHALLVDNTPVQLTAYYAQEYLFTAVDQDHLLSAEFGPDSFDLTILSGQGSVNPPAGVHTYQAGQAIECSLADPVILVDQGRSRQLFTHWTGTGSLPQSGVETLFWVTNRHNSELTWHWKLQHQLRTTIQGAGQINLPPTNWVNAGESVTLTATPAPLNRFVRWSGDIPPEKATQNPVSLEMDAPRTIRAEFAGDTLTLNVFSEFGLADPSIGTRTYPYGTDILASMTTPVFPEEALGTQYVCTGWTGSGSVPPAGTTPEIPSFALETDSSITWNWRTEYELQATADEGGTLTGHVRWHLSGATATINAAPLPGHRFAAWTGDLPPEKAQDRPLQLTMNRARAITATFVTNRPALTVLSLHPATPPLGVHPGDYARVENLKVNQNPFYTNNARFVCTGWTGTGDVPATGTDPAVDVLLTADSSITWNWQKQYALTATGGINGTATPAIAWHNDGTTNATALAIPNVGFEFTGWSGDVGFADTNQNPITLTMDRSRSIRAHFDTLRPTLTVATPHGEGFPAAGTHTYIEGQTIECQIDTPLTSPETTNSRFVCIGWTGSGSVPGSGTANHFGFTIQQPSTLDWLWKTQHTMRVFNSGAGTVQDSPEGPWQDAGSTVVLTPSPERAHLFSHWSGDLPNASLTNTTPLEVTMDRPRTITAHFSTNRPLLAITNPRGASLPPPGTYTHTYEDLIYLTVEPEPIQEGNDTRHVFRGWTGSGSVPPSGNTNALSITITTNSALHWIWHPQYRIELTSGENGMVEGPEPGWHDAGSNITIRAIPDPFYRFTHWSGTPLPAALSNQAAITLGMNKPHNLTAHFTNAPVTITASFEGGGCGSIDPVGTVELNPGSSMTYSLTLGEHCSGYLVIDGTMRPFTNSYTFSNIIQDHTIHAVFDRRNVNLRIGSTLRSGRFSPPAGLAVLKWGDEITARATNSPVIEEGIRYTCIGWTATGSAPTNGTGTATDPFEIREDTEIIWQWSAGYQLEVTHNPHGTVTPGTGWYDADSLVTLTAEPHPHASFIEWRGDIEGQAISSNILVLLMDQPRLIEAVFKLDEIELTILSAHGGSVPPAGTHLHDYGSPVTIRLTNSPLHLGENATQYVCHGYTLDPGGNGTGTEITLHLTNNLTLTWNWHTNYYLDIPTNIPFGTVSNLTAASIADPWVRAAADLHLEAIPQIYHHFIEWTGDLTDVQLATNRAQFTMHRPRALAPVFAETRTTNDVPVPYWWLAQFGITTDFENAVLLDLDGDDYLTWQEWIANTDPTNPNSHLRLESITEPDRDAVRLTWTASSNRYYAVTWSPTLAAAFQPIASNLTFSTPLGEYLIIPPPPGNPAFFNIEVSINPLN